jgi:hypothetical protein
VVGDNYPPGPTREGMAMLIQLVQVVLIFSVALGPRILRSMGMVPPPWLEEQQGAPFFLGVFVLGNLVSGQ